MYKNILVPLDGSELAEQVLPQVIEIAHATGAGIVLLRVLDTRTYDALLTGPEWSTSIHEQWETDARDYLARVSQSLELLDLDVQTELVPDRAVADAIPEVAKQVGADLIAMSTHGRSGLARLAMGSVADEVVRHVRVPVLLVRPQATAQPMPLHYETAYAPLPVN